MRTTICAKIKTQTLHQIDELSKKKGVNRSQYMKIALLNQLKVDKVNVDEDNPEVNSENTEEKRQIKSKITKK